MLPFHQHRKVRHGYIARRFDLKNAKCLEGDATWWKVWWKCEGSLQTNVMLREGSVVRNHELQKSPKWNDLIQKTISRSLLSMQLREVQLFKTSVVFLTLSRTEATEQSGSHMIPVRERNWTSCQNTFSLKNPNTIFWKNVSFQISVQASRTDNCR